MNTSTTGASRKDFQMLPIQILRQRVSYWSLRLNEAKTIREFNYSLKICDSLQKELVNRLQSGKEAK